MGDQRIGNYRIIRKLGEGGMGVVFECVHEYIGRRAAVKVLHADFSRNPEMAVRFLNEARAANIVQHPGIVNIFEFDRLSDGSAYIVMDYLDGDSLTTRMQKQGGKLEVMQALTMGYQVADALTAAHSKGVIHRDLKPDNVMIIAEQGDSTREQAKILDFGIAKVAESHGLGSAVVKTQIGVPMGTPLYMAPEQWKGAADVDAKSDVYSLGVIMFEMLSGQPPFIANSSSEVMALHILATPRLVTELNNQVPEEVAFLINSMLAKLPNDRPAMGQVARELRRILGLGIENSLVSGRVSGGSGSSGVSEFSTGGFRGPNSAAPQPGLRTSGIGHQQASTSAVGPLQLSGISAVGAIGQPALRTSLPPNSGLRTSMGPPQPAEPAPPPGPSPEAVQKAKLMKGALIGLVGLCVLTVALLSYKFGNSSKKPQPVAQVKFEEGGLVWSEVASNTTQNLQDVWGAGQNNSWAVGKSGTLLRWNGIEWKDAGANLSKEMYLNSIWGSAGDDIWVVGKSGVTIHWNGVAWAEVPSGTSQALKDVWGTTKSDVWAVGESGIILHWNGSDWTPTPSGTETELRGIWGSSSKDIWAVGGGDATEGFILHYDGQKWQAHYRAETRLNAIWGSAGDDIWAVGGRPGPEGTVVRWDGSEWKPVAIPRAPWLNAIWGSGSRDIWIAGDAGTILNYNGTAWAEAVSATQLTFKSIHGTSQSDVWAVAINGVIRHWNGKTWNPIPPITQQSLVHVFGTSQTDVWAVGKAGTIVRWDGKKWTLSPSGTTNDLRGLSGSGFGNMWACGDKGTILHWEGQSWAPIQSASSSNLNGLFALTPQDMWAVGDRGTILHWEGQSWASMASPVTTNLTTVFGVDKNDVWAAGDQGIILHWDGKAWLRVQTDASVTKSINTIYGSSPTDLWAAGKQGLLLNWNGRSWVPVQSGTAEDIEAMYGNGRFDVWAVGSGGIILHWNGSAWSKILSKTKQTLQGIWSSRPGDLWVVGQLGLILH